MGETIATNLFPLVPAITPLIEAPIVYDSAKAEPSLI
jgi:hypothetical protein